jgi:hypothetical protein
MMRIEDVDQSLLVSHYNWPPPDRGSHEILRRLTNVVITDESGTRIDMHVKYLKGSKYIAIGQLLSKPESNEGPLPDIKIRFGGYAVDFGTSKKDKSRGYWIFHEETRDMKIWYKIEGSHPVYQALYDTMMNKVKKVRRA